VHVNTGEAEIEREDLQSMGVVTGRLENRDLGSVIKDIQSEVIKKIVLPRDMPSYMAVLMPTSNSLSKSC
jgi:Cu/Ag efflux pump CusA